MTRTFLYPTLLLLFCFSAITAVQAQTPTKQANKLYKNYGYKVATHHFEESDNLSVEEMAKLANSYRLNHETRNAEMWYGRVVEQSDEPLYKLYYAQMLQSNKKYDLAKKYYEAYDQAMGSAEGSDRRGQLLAAAIERIENFEHTDVLVENVDNINSGKLDFSPSYHDNGVVFVSTRKADKEDREFKDIWIDDNFMSIFYAASQEDGTLSTPELFSMDLTTKYHEGPVSFTRSEDRIFFTRNDYIKGKRRNNSKGTMKLEIYTAQKMGGTWSEPTPLPFNTKEYEEAHPAVSADGKYLFFSSDRPEGKGGMDIYVSEFKEGQWSDPVNLGDDVNTAGNEIFPYIHDNGTLYFASNGLGGLGGLDIFTSEFISPTEVVKVKNMGTPFNSSMDDFGFVSNLLGTEGYFTSARENGHGQDDIYHFKKSNRKQVLAKICAYDQETMMRIEGVEVSILIEENEYSLNDASDLLVKLRETGEKDTYELRFKKSINQNDLNIDENFTYTTGETGDFDVELDPNQNYVLVAKKDGYIIAQEEFSTTGRDVDFSTEHVEFCIPLAPLNCATLMGTVINEKFDHIIPNAEVLIVNTCTGEETKLLSDANGHFDYPCVECGCAYKFVGSKKHFIDGNTVKLIDDAICGTNAVVEVELYLNPGENPPSDLLAGTYNPNNTNNPYAPYNPVLPNANRYFEGQELREGAVIELKNIFYDFDEYYIRDDAARELDKVVELMNAFPTMTIELGSHTDARGTDKYNKRLANNRANAAVKYLISKGIDSRRLTDRGYGEDQPRNNCGDFVNCSEEEHQFNRRTEIKIITLGADVGVKYIDNAPEKTDYADPNRKFTWK